MPARAASAGDPIVTGVPLIDDPPAIGAVRSGNRAREPGASGTDQACDAKDFSRAEDERHVLQRARRVRSLDAQELLADAHACAGGSAR